MRLTLTPWQEIRELEGKVGEIDKTIAGFCKELGIEAPFTVVEDVSNGAKASFKNFVLPWKTTTINGKVDIISGFPFEGKHITDNASGTRLMRS
jgi:hypothetical protein